MPRHVPEALQNPAQHVSKPVKIEVRGGPGSQEAHERLFRLAKRRPRVPRKCLRDSQEAAKRDQEPAKSAPKPAK